MADTSQASSGGFNPNIITSAAQSASMIAQTVSNIIDQTKRRQFEQAMSLLTNQQQQQLNQQLMAAQTQAQREAILSSALTQYMASAQAAAQKNQTVMLIVAGALAVTLLIVADI